MFSVLAIIIFIHLNLQNINLASHIYIYSVTTSYFPLCKIMNSLFSFITTLYALVLLYFPSIFFRFLLSPVLLPTLILLLYLLRLGAEQRSTINRTDSDPVELNSTQSLPQQTEEFRDERDSDESSKHCWSYEPDPEQDPRRLYAESFVEWDVRAPLEVIYEEFEGEDAAAAGEDDSEAKLREAQVNSIRRYASLSLFYPESDSDASSEGDFTADRGWESPESACFRWEEEGDDDDREGLIEIALDGKRNCEFEEENLIEIDLSPVR